MTLDYWRDAEHKLYLSWDNGYYFHDWEDDNYRYRCTNQDLINLRKSLDIIIDESSN